MCERAGDQAAEVQREGEEQDGRADGADERADQGEAGATVSMSNPPSGSPGTGSRVKKRSAAGKPVEGRGGS